MRSLRPTGWRRVSVRAGPTDRLEDSPEGRQPDLHRVRPGSGTHPHADQFCLCSGGPSAGYVNPRCRTGCSPTDTSGPRAGGTCASSTGRAPRTDFEENVVMSAGAKDLDAGFSWRGEVGTVRVECVPNTDSEFYG